MNDRFIRIHFEDLLLYPLKTCDRISDTIGLKYNPANQRPSFEKLHQKQPHHFRDGKVTGWEEYYTDDQIQLLKKLHGSTMQELGYKTLEPLKVAHR